MKNKEKLDKNNLVDMLGQTLAINDWVVLSDPNIASTKTLAIKQISGVTDINLRLRSGTKNRYSYNTKTGTSTSKIVDNFVFRKPNEVCLVDQDAVTFMRLSGKL